MPKNTLAQDSGHYFSFILGSEHVGNDHLNNINPGITLGYRWKTSRPGVEWHIEGGVFYNSYEEISPILIGGVSTSVAEIAGGDLRIGLSAGTAYYAELAPTLKQNHGIPNIGGYIPIVGITAAWRKDEWDYRLTTVPAGVDTKAILNFSIARRY
jgi:hypothetical protein